MNTYLLLKSLHLIAVVSWMAGLLYLPRIYVYHVENKEKKEATEIFEVMERKLIFLHYASCNDIYLDIWISFDLFEWNRNFFTTVVSNKIVLVILLSAYNDFLGKCLVSLKNSTNTRSAKFFRIINEIPTVILIIVVFLAIFKPI